jgi:hypothetical protein
MYLLNLIEFLQARDPSQTVRIGFGKPHSYRGYYDELAFEPVRDTTVGAMLEAAQSANGRTFTGYKGGDYTMGDYTNCWLAQWGEASQESIGITLLQFMLGEI